MIASLFDKQNLFGVQNGADRIVATYGRKLVEPLRARAANRLSRGDDDVARQAKYLLDLATLEFMTGGSGAHLRGQAHAEAARELLDPKQPTATRAAATTKNGRTQPVKGESYVDRNHKRYSSCLHESGHVAACFVCNVDVVSALVRYDLSGVVSHSKTYDRYALTMLAVAGHAASGDCRGLYGDVADLREIGLAAGYMGSEYTGTLEPYEQSEVYADALKACRKLLAPYGHNINKLADYLFQRPGIVVPARELIEVWNSCNSG